MIPDGITPRVAWRGWRVVSRGGAIRLSSTTGDGDVWEPGKPLRAGCRSLGRRADMGTLNVSDPAQMEFVRRHSVPGWTPTVYDVDEAEHRLYFTKKSYLVVPAPALARLVIPSIACSCGIYATEDLEEAGRYANDGVLGRVALWGQVVDHSSGYRGQYAYPQALYVAPGGLEAARIAFADYGVPVLSIGEVRVLAKPAPPPPPTRPPEPPPAEGRECEGGME